MPPDASFQDEVLRVATFGTFLATRHRAATVAVQAERLLRQLDPALCVVLDFAGVEVITGGFADELVVKLQATHGHRIGVTGANESVLETIAVARGRAEEATDA